LIATVEGWQRRWVAELRSRVVFFGGENYLLAGLPPPPGGADQGFSHPGDRVGPVRPVEGALGPAVARPRAPRRGAAAALGRGEMFAPRLVSLLGGVGIDTDTVRVAAVPNDFFGRAIGVAGLLTGRDIQRCLGAQPDLGRAVLVPAVALRDVDGVFLDDQTPT